MSCLNPRINIIIQQQTDGPLDTGIVYQNVYFSKFIDGSVHDKRHIIGVEDTSTQCDSASA